MKLRQHPIHFKSLVTIAMALLCMTAMNVTAAEDDSVDVFSYPFVVDNENMMSWMLNGYHFELWKQKAGTVKMTIPNDDAKFKVEWNSINNFVARVGLKFDETQKHDEIGTFAADLEFQGGGVQGSGLAYYGIYGWTVDTLSVKEDSSVEYSLVEFYVMEDWDNWRPKAGDGSHNLLGNITVDGAQYEVITRQMQNQPSIKGTASFPQVFSIRKQPRSKGSISISDHFKEWEKLGIELGYMYEVKIKVESYSDNNSSSGSCNVTNGVITVDGQAPEPYTSVLPQNRYTIATDKNIATQGVYTLISLTGQKVKSITMNPSKPAVISTDDVAPGKYFLHSRIKGVTPTVKPVLVK